MNNQYDTATRQKAPPMDKLLLKQYRKNKNILRFGSFE
jgi:hypothetical protein